MQNKDTVAKEMIGEADLSEVGFTFALPTPARLTEPLDPGMVLKGYCENCGSYPEYPIESARKLSEQGKFVLPKVDDLVHYYVAVNSCEICKKKVDPEITLNKIE